MVNSMKAIILNDKANLIMVLPKLLNKIEPEFSGILHEQNHIRVKSCFLSSVSHGMPRSQNIQSNSANVKNTEIYRRMLINLTNVIDNTSAIAPI